MPQKTFMIDFHTHCFTDSLAPRAIQTLTEKGGLLPHHDGTASGLVALQEKSGVSLSVIMPIATKPSQAASINPWAKQVETEYAGKLLAFGSVHPESENYRAEIAQLKELGLHGVKLHPEYQNFQIDDRRYYSFYEAIFSADLPILFHAGGDVAYAPPYHSRPQAVARLVKSFPGATIIAAHLGGFEMWEEAEEELAGLDIYLDLSTAAGRLEKERFLRFCRAHGTDKILFGTDSPWYDPAEVICTVETAGFTEKELTQIFCENAKKVLKIF